MIRDAWRSLMAGLLIVLGLAAAASAETNLIASDARLAGDQTRTRFIADLSDAVEVSVFALAAPYRVIVDLPEIEFRLPADAGEGGRGLVEAYRFGLFAPGKSRIVLDASGPVSIDKAFVLDPIDDQPARLVIDLVQTDEETFAQTVASDGEARERAARAAPGPDIALAMPGDIRARPMIVLDPGHGGIDPGAISTTGIAEKTVVLDFTTLLREKLLETGAFDVVMTREDDRFLSLAERVRFSREHGADLFVSIHADSIRSHDVRGATVYTLSEEASDHEAAALAHQENQADLVAGLPMVDEANDDVTSILFDLATRESKNFSIMFAKTLVDELKSAATMNKNPHRSAGFRVLTAQEVPSALLELGYLSSPHDAKLLTSDEWRARATDAFVQAVSQHFGRRTAVGAF